MMRYLLLVLAVAAAMVLPGPAALADEPQLVLAIRTMSGSALPAATVTVDGSPIEPGTDGRLVVGEPGRLVVSAPAYLPVEYRWDGRPGRLTISLAPRPVFAIHVTGEVAGSDSRWASLLDLADSTAINALVIDLKDESGLVFSATPSGRAAETGAEESLFDLEERARQAHERGLYVIVRVVTFLDPITGPARPEWTAWDPGRSRPFAKGWQVFLDPWDTDARSYSLDLATDACRMGADEVQFDYVRFPDGFGSRIQFDGPSDADGRADAITSFLTEARAALSSGGCATAAAIFGFITSTPGEGGIGQQLERLAGVVDVLSPMVYPSHYSTGWYGFADPNAHPYDVVSGALLDGERRLTGSPVVVRPWIQSFYYNGSQIQAESNAADDRGAGWMLWNSASNYATGSIVDESTLEVAQHSSSATFRLFPLSGFFRAPRRQPFARVWME